MTRKKNISFLISTKRTKKSGRGRKRSSRPQAKRRRKKPLTKKEYKAVKQVAKSVVKQQIETKYLNTGAWTNLNIGDAQNNPANYFYLHDLTPQIRLAQGDSNSTRNGNVVNYQNLILRMILKPMYEYFTLAYTTDPSLGLGVQPNKNKRNLFYRISLMRIDAGSTITPVQLHELVSVPGRNRQDFLQATSQNFKKDIKVLKQMSLRPKWQYSQQQPTEYALPSAQTIQHTNIPIQTIHTFKYNFKNLKVLLDDATGDSQTYKYKLLIQYMRADNNTVYNDIGFSNLSFRTLFTFKDA